MLSYKQWKIMNESVLPSFNLGLGRPSNLGIQSQFGFDESEHMHKKKKKKMKGDSDLVEPAEKKDEPDVDVEVKGKKHKHGKKTCSKCGEMCGAMSTKKCAKCKMEDAEANYANILAEMDDEEGMGDEGHDDEEFHLHHGDEDEEGHDEDEESHDEDEDEDDEEGHDHDEEDHEEIAHDEEDKYEARSYGKKYMCGDAGEKAAKESMNMKKMSKMYKMKKMLKGGQKKLDVSGPHGKPDGKITGHDFAELRNRKGHDKKKHQGKNEKVKSEDVSWWNSVNSMLDSGNPAQKFSSGCEALFTSVDTDNLYQAVRQNAE